MLQHYTKKGEVFAACMRRKQGIDIFKLINSLSTTESKAQLAQSTQNLKVLNLKILLHAIKSPRNTKA